MNTTPIYLDHPSTSWPKAPGVARAMAEAIDQTGSPGRGSHQLARRASTCIEGVREQIAEMLSVKDRRFVIFTSGTTFSLNLALKGLLVPGDHLVATCFDHNSVLRPLVELRSLGCEFSIVRCIQIGEEFVRQTVAEFRPTTRLLVVNHASNVCGNILPVERLVQVAHDHGICVLVDAAQSVGHIPINLTTLSADLVAFGAHKALLGPPGVGCLVINNSSLQLRPLTTGGTGQESDRLDPTPLLPVAFEAGTLNTPGIAGLGAALRFMVQTEWVDAQHRAVELRRHLWEELSSMNHIELQGSSQSPCLPILSFSVRGQLPEKVGDFLESQHNILVRSGLHCAPIAHQTLGTGRYGSVRVGFGYGNSPDCVAQLCRALESLNN